MRKALEMADAFRIIGIDFVPIPVKDEEHKAELLNIMNYTLEEITEAAEEGEAKSE